MNTHPLPTVPQRKTARQYFRLSPQQQAELKALAQRRDTSISQLIREGVKLLLRQQELDDART